MMLKFGTFVGCPTWFGDSMWKRSGSLDCCAFQLDVEVGVESVECVTDEC